MALESAVWLVCNDRDVVLHPGVALLRDVPLSS
jgi:hypothetical protein